jgi:hypothetical protein
LKAGAVVAAASVLFFLGSCSRPAQVTKSGTAKGVGPAVNANKEMPADAVPDANTLDSPAEAAEGASTEQTTANRLAAVRKTGADVSPGELAKAIDRSAQPAPDNSVYTSTLTDIGRETRTFRSHEQLLKVEKLITPAESVLKVHLRDGRILQLPGASIPNLATVSANEILMKAGVRPASAAGADKSAKTTKSGKE